MKPKLTEKGITYKTISRVGTILLTIFVFFDACAYAYAQEPAAVAAVAAVAADDAMEAPAAVAADDALEAPTADDELTMTAVKEAKAAKAASSDITTLFYSLPKQQNNTELLTDASNKLLFNHLAIGIGIGTEGASLDLALPIGHYVQLRAGMSYLPSIKLTKHFDASQTGSAGVSNFDSITSILHDITGLQFDEQIDMKATTQLWNGKILVDVFPFKKKNWFFSAGLYFGPKQVLHIENAAEDMGTLIALSTFNNIYNKVEDAIANDNPAQIFGDISLTPQMMDQIMSIGRLGIAVGTYKQTTESHQAGDIYNMVPDENGMIKLDIRSNVVRPYVGFGYRTAISRDKRSFFSVDAGILCWGTLKMITHDGTNLIKEVDVTNPMLKQYTDVVNHMKVYPAINIRFTRQIF
ncbi:MAG: hypothetical protein MST03_04535 [Bacteroidales bacterium]|nr:hypothetical protein [Bacteroidales bacterium]